jgi:hypothetical protein
MNTNETTFSLSDEMRANVVRRQLWGRQCALSSRRDAYTLGGASADHKTPQTSCINARVFRKKFGRVSV